MNCSNTYLSTVRKIVNVMKPMINGEHFNQYINALNWNLHHKIPPHTYQPTRDATFLLTCIFSKSYLPFKIICNKKNITKSVVSVLFSLILGTPSNAGLLY